jgi:orotate phosphoribosyltransferase
LPRTDFLTVGTNLMHFRSVAALNESISRWANRLPRDIEIVVGIPRSGLLAASLLALHRNLPITDVEGLLAGRVLQLGPRYNGKPVEELLQQPTNVLVLDDSVLSGSQLRHLRERIDRARLPHRIQYAAVYAAPGAEPLVDFHAEIVPLPRCFEWNLMHNRPVLSRTCMDIDGVLCRDPTPEENDDGENYLRFLSTAEALHRPTHRVGWLVTSRLEKYRVQTEGWLAAHGIEYGELLMMDYPDKAARQAAQAYARFKADVYRRTRAWLFVESSPRLAQQIANLARKDVYCPETRELVSPAGIPAARRRAERLSSKLVRLAERITLKVVGLTSTAQVGDATAATGTPSHLQPPKRRTVLQDAGAARYESD